MTAFVGDILLKSRFLLLDIVYGRQKPGVGLSMPRRDDVKLMNHKRKLRLQKSVVTAASVP